jgi:hypothetical protein
MSQLSLLVFCFQVQCHIAVYERQAHHLTPEGEPCINACTEPRNTRIDICAQSMLELTGFSCPATMMSSGGRPMYDLRDLLRSTLSPSHLVDIGGIVATCGYCKTVRSPYVRAIAGLLCCLCARSCKPPWRMHASTA